MKIVNLSRSKILSPRFLFIRFYYLGKFRHRLRRREFRLRESSLSRFVRIFLYFVIITFGKGRGIKISRAIYAINFFLFPSPFSIIPRKREARINVFPASNETHIQRGKITAELYASWRKNTTRGALSNEKYHGKFHGTVARDV